MTKIFLLFTVDRWIAFNVNPFLSSILFSRWYLVGLFKKGPWMRGKQWSELGNSWERGDRGDTVVFVFHTISPLLFLPPFLIPFSFRRSIQSDCDRPIGTTSRFLSSQRKTPRQALSIRFEEMGEFPKELPWTSRLFFCWVTRGR